MRSDHVQIDQKWYEDIYYPGQRIINNNAEESSVEFGR
jgi:hypothetical protein